MTLALRETLADRYARVNALNRNAVGQQLELEMCRRSYFHWLHHWGWTFDPRLADEGKTAYLPFILYPRQVELVRWLDARVAGKEFGLLEKSRDIGFTWIIASYAWHKWRFQPGFKTTFASRKQEYVDELGNLDSFFERIRVTYRRLPRWMLPANFMSRHHDNSMLLINPENANIITGETGTDIGRGGRSTLFVLDEAAFVPNAEAADAATSANANCRIWGSTVAGMGNLFAKKRHGGKLRDDQIFRFHWSDDPRKSAEWARAKRNDVEDHVFASEYDIDYSASIEGIFIPGAWVDAACEIGLLMLARGMPLLPQGRGVAGQDVGGGGSGKSVFVARHGPVVSAPKAWGDPDTTETAIRALDLAEEHKCASLNFDSVGIGAGVNSTLTRAGRYGLTVAGINTGLPASEAVWPDGMIAKAKFINIKGEIWSKARERFRTTYRMVLWLKGLPGGVECQAHEVISLPSGTPECHALRSQISLPKRVTAEPGNKIAVEKKSDLRKRGISSPDFADALMLTFIENNELEAWLGAFG